MLQPQMFNYEWTDTELNRGSFVLYPQVDLPDYVKYDHFSVPVKLQGISKVNKVWNSLNKGHFELTALLESLSLCLLKFRHREKGQKDKTIEVRKMTM